jgi:hypothetical protein
MECPQAALALPRLIADSWCGIALPFEWRYTA